MKLSGAVREKERMERIKSIIVVSENTIKESIVRFSLQDVKKSVRRQADKLAVTLHFLRSGELQEEIQRLIAYHEGLLGQPQRGFSLDEARACVGDYRLAYCLLATLSHWYNWRSPDWATTLQSLRATDTLLEVASPAHLRLALYTYVSERYDGFLDTERREKALRAFARIYDIGLSDLEYLLALDGEAEALLVREVAQPPDFQEVAALYNQWVFEAALFNASDVHFVIDCGAFSQAQARELFGGEQPAMGLGAVIKRLCFLARKLGVYYDLSYEQTLPGGQLPGLLLLTLYGPQDVTGMPQQYGLRLARLCRLLLGYGASGGRGQRRATLNASAIVEAAATVHFLQRSYNFTLDADLLRLLPAPESVLDHNAPAGVEVSKLFDSSIEQAFSEAFMALAGNQGTDGWRLEREPEPLLLEHSIFIADFALTRDQRRIYVEILGFWTPAYRERKLQKLQELKGRDDLLLAIPHSAKAAFAAIETDFPIVFYAEQLVVTDILHMLRTRYDDFAERLRQIDSAAVRARVRQDGLLTERVCYEVLCCYRRSELVEAAERVLAADILFVPGLGLYHVPHIELLRSDLLAWLRNVRTASLDELARAARAHWSGQAAWRDGALESLLALWPEFYVNRTSIFETTIDLVEDRETNEDGEKYKEVLPPAPGQLIKQAPAKQVRERRASLQKRKGEVEQQATQEGLWD